MSRRINLCDRWEFPRRGSEGLRTSDVMPWVLGDESAFRVIASREDRCALIDVVPDLFDPNTLFAGYLLDGFTASLESDRLKPRRLALDYRGGWSAVTVVARIQDSLWADRLGPFQAPTAPRPHARVPLGFTLFQADRLRGWLEREEGQRRSSLGWAAAVTASVSSEDPAFCDPILELDLSGLSDPEQEHFAYRPPSHLALGLRALFGFELMQKGSADRIPRR